MSERPAALPCWYELTTVDLDAATGFYTGAVGWTVTPSGMPGLDYRIATTADQDGVAGLSADPGQSPRWIFYVEVADCDGTAAQAVDAGGSILTPPSDIPGTGRFAVLADPQGAVFGILQPLPMDEPPSARAYDSGRIGHGSWHELSTSDAAGAFAFYGSLFGWTHGDTMNMGEHGDYEFVNVGDAMLGGVMGLMGDPAPSWRVYVGVDSAQGCVERARAAGGTIEHGPAQVPGGSWVAMITDPQGARFGISSQAE